MLDNVSRMILNDTLASLQAADEAGGPDLVQYVALMDVLIVEATRRRDCALRTIGQRILELDWLIPKEDDPAKRQALRDEQARLRQGTV